MIVPDIVRLSPNVNDEPMPASCRTVIIHCTRSGTSMNPTEFTGTLNYMAQPGTASSQLVIGRKANQIARVVPDNRQAHHAQEDNDNAWGIEVEQGAENDGFTAVQLSQLVTACKHYRDEFGVPVRHASNSTEGGFIGHQETVQGRRNGKSDPGHLFPWEWFLSELAPAPAPSPRVWVYGNEVAGCEVRGQQLFYWHNGVEVDAVGDYEGAFPGAHYHREGENWRQTLP